jgi:hypothetical protein
MTPINNTQPLTQHQKALALLGINTPTGNGWASGVKKGVSGSGPLVPVTVGGSLTTRYYLDPVRNLNGVQNMTERASGTVTWSTAKTLGWLSFAPGVGKLADAARLIGAVANASPFDLKVGVSYTGSVSGDDRLDLRGTQRSTVYEFSYDGGLGKVGSIPMQQLKKWLGSFRPGSKEHAFISVLGN